MTEADIVRTIDSWVKRNHRLLMPTQPDGHKYIELNADAWWDLINATRGIA